MTWPQKFRRGLLPLGSSPRNALAKQLAYTITPKEWPHLPHLLDAYQRYYNGVRTHLSLRKDAPVPREVRVAGRVLPVPILGGAR